MSQDESRYFMWKKIVGEVKGKMDRGDIMSKYLEQLNKCRFHFEFDDVLDAIIENEKMIKVGRR